MENNLKIAVICNSDSLAMPSIFSLVQKKSLVGVVILKKNSPMLLPLLLNIGVSSENILIIERNNFEEDLTNWLHKKMANVVYVFGFPWKINSSITAIPKFGFLNFHYGTLPKYAGADPIFWQIKNGESNIELSVHHITDKIDEGPIAYIKKFQIVPGENYAMLCHRLGIETAQEINNIPIHAADHQTSNIQQENNSLFYKKPDIADLTIKWNLQSAQEIEHLVNACNPKYGGAITFLENRECRILEVSPVDMKDEKKVSPGVVVYADNVYGLIISCKDNKYLRIGVAHLSEGYFSGSKLFNIGIKTGAKFN